MDNLMNNNCVLCILYNILYTYIVRCTVSENIIGASKIKNNYGAIQLVILMCQQYWPFLYCSI